MATRNYHSSYNNTEKDGGNGRRYDRNGGHHNHHRRGGGGGGHRRKDGRKSYERPPSTIQKLSAKDWDHIRFLTIFNIPPQYRSKHLRNFFHYMIEHEAFVCFHYRHRPQKISVKSDRTGTKIDGRKQPPLSRFCALVAIHGSWLPFFMSRYNNKFWTGDDGDDIPLRCYIRPVEFRNDLNQKQMEKLQNPLLNEAISLCSWRSQRQFSRATFGNQNNETESSSTFNDDNSVSKIDLSKILELQEFNTPPFMPSGNVGTPLNYFLEKISSCQMPHYIIYQLGLKFPRGQKTKSFAEYGYDYDKEPVPQRNRRNQSRNFPHFDEMMRTASGQIISENYAQYRPVVDRSAPETKYLHLTILKEAAHGRDEEEEAWIDDQGLGEDNNDKERIFEEPVEVTWDKGSSGLVFYTDEQFWQTLETDNHDFDAMTADNFNIETEAEFMDKDMKDLSLMCHRRDRNRDRNSDFVNCPEGHRQEDEPKENKNRPPPRIQRKGKKPEFGEFEKHTKGFGKKMLEKYGWEKGQGLGQDNAGIAEPLDQLEFGQFPDDRRGLGFYGPKLFGAKARGPAISLDEKFVKK